MEYREAWEFLDRLQFFKIKLGLDSMARFLEDLGRPQDRLRFVHVAGTNGKGSMAVTLQTVLARAGYRVGLYTSPHLSSVRERFQINGHYIPEEDFAEIASEIVAILQDRQITYFEFTTALAFCWFARQQVDLAILEVGMGGRLDATNVITPLVSVITNVTMDHQAYLGETLPAVAREKAGIIKAGVPVVSGVDADESLEVVADTCRSRQAPLFLLGREFQAEKTREEAGWSYRGWGPAPKAYAGLPAPLLGAHQVGNSGMAVAVLDLLEEQGYQVTESDLRAGLGEVRWPGRLEYFCLEVAAPPAERNDFSTTPQAGRRRYLLDGAHNPAGVASLQQALAGFSYEKLVMIWASMADKEFGAMLQAIAGLCTHLILTRPESERSALPTALLECLPAAARSRAICAATVPEALQAAARLATAADLICVAGSLYLVGAARKQLLGELAGS